MRLSFSSTAFLFTLLAGLVCGGLPAPPAQASEAATIGLPGGPIFSIDITLDDTDSVYVGTGLGVFKSVYQEDIWTPADSGLASSFVYDVVPASVTSTTLFAASKEGLFKTTDGGAQWASLGLSEYQTFVLNVNPVTPTLMAAGTSDGVFVSTDGGSLWSAEPAGPGFVYALAVDPLSPTVVYAGSFSEGVFRSTDSGATWSATGSIASNVNDVIVSPTATGTLYAGTNNGIYKSTNSGSSWAALSAEFSGSAVYCVSQNPGSPYILYAATDKGAYKTIDSGNTWAAINNGIASEGNEGPFVRVIALDPENASILYAGTYSGNTNDVDIYRSTNSGASWKQINRELSNTSVFSLAFDSGEAGHVYAGTGTVGVLKSTSRGDSWLESNANLTNYFVRQIAVNPDSSVVYAGTPSGLFLSSDAGETWEEASPSQEVYSIAVDPETPAHVYLGTNNGLFLTTDDGAEWSSLNNNLINPNVLSILVVPDETITLFVGTRGDGVFKSLSGGEVWTAVNQGLNDLQVNVLAVDPEDDGVLYAGTDSGLYKTTNGAETWESIDPDNGTLSIRALAVNPDGGEVIYAGTQGRGLYRTSDGGQTWEVAVPALANKTVYDLVFDPDNSRTVLAALEGDIAVYLFNSPPEIPHDPAPADNATDELLSVPLGWISTDPDPGDSVLFSVYFGTDPDPDNNTPVVVAETFYDPGLLELDQTYSWRVEARDSQGELSRGPVWRFTTLLSNPPLEPSDPTPIDGALDQVRTVSLGWTGGDPDNDTVTYDIYLGTAEAPRIVKRNHPETTFAPPRPLKARRTYFWKIVARDSHDLETEGPVWRFETGTQCFAESVLGQDAPELAVLRQLREQVLMKSSAGRELAALYDRLSPVLVALADQDAALKRSAARMIKGRLPEIERWVATGTLAPTPELIRQGIRLLDAYGRQAGPPALAVIGELKSRIVQKAVPEKK